MANSKRRLYIQKVDSQTVQVEATPTMLLFLTGELLGLAQGDPNANYDDFLMSGVQLDDGSEELLVCRVSDARSYSRYNNPVSPEKLEPLQIVPGYSSLQLNASKDGLIKLSLAFIDIVMSKAPVSHLIPGKELGEGSLSVTVHLLPDDIT